MIAIVTDTCASIPPDLVRELQIEVVPYYIHRDGETLRDVLDISHDEFYRWLPTAQRLPTTANPGPGDYLQAFQRVAERGATAIVSVHMTSKGSGAYQAARTAQEMAEARLPGVAIRVIDTLQVSMVHGYAAVEAARAAQRGASLEEVVSAAEHVAGVGCMFQVADTLRYLYMGGRIGRAKHLVGTLLNVKPIVSMEEGIVVPVGQARSMAQAYLKVAQLVAERTPTGRPIKLAITHTACPDRAQALQEAITRRVPCTEVLISQLSPALGVHTGPGMVGANFFPV